MELSNFTQPLYSFDAKGKVRIYECWVEGNTFYSRSGLVYKKDGSRGKLTTKTKNISQKKGSDSAEESAMKYADQEWRKKQRKGAYFPHHELPSCTKEEWLEMKGDRRRWPAVCKDSSKVNMKTIFQDCELWIGQPKVDGDRITAWIIDGEVKLYSRSCLEKENLEDLRVQIFELMTLISDLTDRDISTFGIDGELYVPEFKHHQQSRSVTSRTVNKSEDESKLLYAIFDIMVYGEHETFSERVQMLEIMKETLEDEDEDVKELFKNLTILETTELRNHEDIEKLKERALSLGYDEGVVIRRSDLLYEKEKERKHNGMIKIKYECDAEFEVVGFQSADAEREGCIVWELKTEEGMNFTCAQMGDLEYQRELFNAGDSYIGKLITVKYMKLTADGIPCQPRAIRFRHDSDLAI